MVNDFFDNIYSNYKNVTKMTIFNYFKTGNVFFDTIITTVLISSFSWLLEFIFRQNLDRLLYSLTFDDIKNWFCKKNMVIIEGKRSSVISAFMLYY